MNANELYPKLTIIVEIGRQTELVTFFAEHTISSYTR